VVNDDVMCARAKARAIVVLRDGRTARLVYWPGSRGPHRRGGRPKVLLPSGAYVAIDTADIHHVEMETP
jgi:hypothetical protein